MENESVIFHQLVLLSRRIQILFYILFPTGVILGMLLQIKWLGILGPTLICASWLVPGISIALKAPWLAQAWLRGISTNFPDTPWDQLSKGQKFSVYFSSISCFLAAVSIIVLFITSLFR